MGNKFNVLIGAAILVTTVYYLWIKIRKRNIKGNEKNTEIKNYETDIFKEDVVINDLINDNVHDKTCDDDITLLSCLSVDNTNKTFEQSFTTNLCRDFKGLQIASPMIVKNKVLNKDVDFKFEQEQMFHVSEINFNSNKVFNDKIIDDEVEEGEIVDDSIIITEEYVVSSDLTNVKSHNIIEDAEEIKVSLLQVNDSVLEDGEIYGDDSTNLDITESILENIDVDDKTENIILKDIDILDIEEGEIVDDDEVQIESEIFDEKKFRIVDQIEVVKGENQVEEKESIDQKEIGKDDKKSEDDKINFIEEGKELDDDTIEIIKEKRTSEDDKFEVAEEGDEIEVADENDKVEFSEEDNVIEVAEEDGKIEATEKDDKIVVDEDDKVEVVEEEDKVEVVQEEDKVEVAQEEHKVEVSQEEDKVEVAQEEDKVEVAHGEDKVEVAQEEDKVEVAQEDDKVKVTQEEDIVEVTQEEDIVEVAQEEDKVEVSQEEDKVEVAQEEDKIEVAVEEDKVEVAQEDDKVEVAQKEDKFEVAQEEDKVEVAQEEKKSEDIKEKKNIEEFLEVYESSKDNEPIIENKKVPELKISKDMEIIVEVDVSENKNVLEEIGTVVQNQDVDEQFNLNEVQEIKIIEEEVKETVVVNDITEVLINVRNQSEDSSNGRLSSLTMSEPCDYVDNYEDTLDNLITDRSLMNYIDDCLHESSSDRTSMTLKNENTEERDVSSSIENWQNDEDSLNNIKRDFYELTDSVCSPHPSSESDHAHCVNNLTERVATHSAESILINTINRNDSESTPTLSSPSYESNCCPELYVEKIQYGDKELDVVYFDESVLEDGGVISDVRIVRTIPVGISGRIIGKKGKTKNELLKKYGAELLIYNHPSENCKQVLQITCSPAMQADLEKWVDKTLDQILRNTIQTTVSNPEWLKPMIPIGKMVPIQVIDMPTIQHLKIRIHDPTMIRAYNKMQAEINADYANADSNALLPSPVATGCICIAMIRPDYFLRAEIISIYDQYAVVYLYDLGKTHQTCLYYLFKIREKYMRVPFQVLPARMPHAVIKNKKFTSAMLHRRFLCDQKTLKPLIVRGFFPRMNTCCEPCVHLYVSRSSIDGLSGGSEDSGDCVDLLELLVSMDVCAMARETVDCQLQVTMNEHHYKQSHKSHSKDRTSPVTPAYFEPINGKFYEDYLQFQYSAESASSIPQHHNHAQ